MNTSRPAKQEWVLSQRAFDRLLASMGGERELAGEKYEELRRKLIKLFEWRGVSSPEESVDETLNRVARKIDEGLNVEDISAYSYAVARLVYLEWIKAPARKDAPLGELADAERPVDKPDPTRIELPCFQDCLGKLPADARSVIVQYYREEKRAKIDHRKELAQRLGIPLNALRSRAQRTRQKLEQCITECLKSKA